MKQVKQATVFPVALLCIAALTSCADAPAAVTGAKDTVTIEMQLDEHYDDEDPFVNEKLFCVSEDVGALTARGTLEMDGQRGVLEVKNNKTHDVLWSGSWEGAIPSETFSVPLQDLKAADEYVVCFTGTGIRQADVTISFDDGAVQERETPRS